MKLLNENDGWIAGAGKVLTTTDAGAHWRDVTPPASKTLDGAPTLPIQSGSGSVSAYFLDRETAWVLTVDPNSSADSVAIVWLTADGGRTWSQGSFPRFDEYNWPDRAGITFADRLHGWIAFVVADSIPSETYLLRTSDGGHTWSGGPASDGPAGPSILASSEQNLWTVGGSRLELPVLYSSRDSGLTFGAVKMPLPAEIPPDTEPDYYLPVFEDSQTGYEMVLYAGGFDAGSAVALFATQDSGRTWHLDRMVSHVPNLSAPQVLTATVAAGTWMFASAPGGGQPQLLKLPRGSGIADDTVVHLGHFVERYSCPLTFASADVGWVGCNGKLYSTRDGGTDWTEITPHLRDGFLTLEPVTPPRVMRLRTHAWRGGSPMRSPDPTLGGGN